MNQLNDLELLYTGDGLGDLLDTLDDLHSAASENRLHTVTTMSERELLGLLKDVIYTAQEAIAEIEAAKQHRAAAKASPRAAAPLNVVPFVAPESNGGIQETRHA